LTEKRRKLGDCEAVIDELWAAIEALPDPEPETDAKRPSKQDEVIAMLRRPEGVTIDEVARATGWQRHTVRRLLGRPQEEARADDRFRQRGTRPRLPHQWPGKRMKPAINDTCVGPALGRQLVLGGAAASLAAQAFLREME